MPLFYTLLSTFSFRSTLFLVFSFQTNVQIYPDTYFFPTDFKFPSFGDTFTEAQSILSKQLFKKPTFEATTTSFTSNSHQLKSDSLTAITEETASESNSDKKNSHQHLSSSRMIPAESKYTYKKGSILDPYFDLQKVTLFLQIFLPPST